MTSAIGITQNKVDVIQLNFYFLRFLCYHMGFSYAQKAYLDLGCLFGNTTDDMPSIPHAQSYETLLAGV